jgi:MFS family permease
MTDGNAGSTGTKGSLSVILLLGTTQTLAWASSYYLPAILAAPIARDLGLTPTFVFGALSGALIIAGLLGPRVGHFIDTFGGRGLLAISNLVFAAGLGLLSISTGVVSLAAAWIILGVGMGMGLYEAAFATLTRIYGSTARSSITGITLVAGFASTVGWPISTLLDAEFGWRIACQVWALVHLLIALPLNLLLPRAQPLSETPAAAAPTAPAGQSENFAMIALAYAFAAVSFVGSGVAAVLPTIFVQFGATPAAALFAGMLIGPSQVGARIIEAAWLQRYHPLVSARLATLTNPIGVLVLTLGGPVLAPLFTVFYGTGNGILTISRGALPLALFGPQGFGRRVGMISLPARITGALAPLAIGLMAETIGIATLWVTALASMSAFVALMLLRAKPAT